MSDVVYMDYAATAALRPAEVVDAVTHYLADIGATPGRGAHRLALDAGRITLHCRQALAALLHIPGDAARIAFMANATQALNTALWGTLQRDQRVVVTAFDHNAVLRPAARLARERNVEVRLVRGCRDGSLDESALLQALAGARLLSINAASNVLGTTLDVTRLTRIAHEHGALVVVDLAQLAGHAPFDAAASDVDMIAITGHKGLLGPQGIGALWVRAGVDIDPLIAGGTGGNSLEREMPAAFPDHLEAGTLNGPGIAGLHAGIEFLQRTGVSRIQAHTTALKQRLHEGLSALRDVRVVSPLALDGVPIVSVVCDRLDTATVASRLDREHGVLTRPGLHCAPEAHRLLGTERTGAVRFSLGHASTEADVDAAVRALAAVVASA